VTQPRHWLDEIVDAIGELGGEGSLDAIYDTIQARNVMRFDENPHWRDRVRATLQRFSRDSTWGRHRIAHPDQDVFFAPHGINAGHWAIRGYVEAVQDIEKLADSSYAETTATEGSVLRRFVVTYERKPALRAAAIQLHGMLCKGCEFSFEAVYGELGHGFIEVHHLRPVSTFGRAILVSPLTDMTVLCSNCHRMVHLNRAQVLPIQTLRAIVMSRREQIAQYP